MTTWLNKATKPAMGRPSLPASPSVNSPMGELARGGTWVWPRSSSLQ